MYVSSLPSFCELVNSLLQEAENHVQDIERTLGEILEVSYSSFYIRMQYVFYFRSVLKKVNAILVRTELLLQTWFYMCFTLIKPCLKLKFEKPVLFIKNISNLCLSELP